jgi:hypothetical protein
MISRAEVPGLEHVLDAAPEVLLDNEVGAHPDAGAGQAVGHAEHGRDGHRDRRHGEQEQADQGAPEQAAEGAPGHCVMGRTRDAQLPLLIPPDDRCILQVRQVALLPCGLARPRLARLSAHPGTR